MKCINYFDKLSTIEAIYWSALHCEAVLLYNFYILNFLKFLFIMVDILYNFPYARYYQDGNSEHIIIIEHISLLICIFHRYFKWQKL